MRGNAGEEGVRVNPIISKRTLYDRLEKEGLKIGDLDYDMERHEQAKKNLNKYGGFSALVFVAAFATTVATLGTSAPITGPIMYSTGPAATSAFMFKMYPERALERLNAVKSLDEKIHTLYEVRYRGQEGGVEARNNMIDIPLRALTDALNQKGIDFKHLSIKHTCNALESMVDYMINHYAVKGENVKDLLSDPEHQSALVTVFAAKLAESLPDNVSIGSKMRKIMRFHSPNFTKISFPANSYFQNNVALAEAYNRAKDQDNPRAQVEEPVLEAGLEGAEAAEIQAPVPEARLLQEEGVRANGVVLDIAAAQPVVMGEAPDNLVAQADLARAAAAAGLQQGERVAGV